MKTRARSSWQRSGAWTTSCSSPNPTSKRSWKSCGLTFTPKARITRQRACRNARSPRGLAFASPLLAIQRIIQRAVCLNLSARRRMPDPKLLVVRLSSLGDIVHTFPAVAALRESFPNAEIVWLTHPRWKLLVESSGLASEVWAAETRLLPSLRAILRRIREKRFSIAIDYQGLWKSAALPLFGRIPRRIGFSAETIREYGVPMLYTDRVRCTQTHIADQNGELSSRAGAQRGCAGFSLNVSPSDAARVDDYLQVNSIEHYVALSPGGGWRSKCWPPERFGVLCKKMREALRLRCVV